MTRIGTTPRRDRAGIAWLAILTLRINQVFPAALSAAAGQNSHDAPAWCGTAPNHPRPDHGARSDLALSLQRSARRRAHAASEPKPPTGAIAVALYRAAESFASPWRSSYPPAQPRGPPARPAPSQPRPSRAERAAGAAIRGSHKGSSDVIVASRLRGEFLSPAASWRRPASRKSKMLGPRVPGKAENGAAYLTLVSPAPTD